MHKKQFWVKQCGVENEKFWRKIVKKCAGNENKRLIDIRV